MTARRFAGLKVVAILGVVAVTALGLLFLRAHLFDAAVLQLKESNFPKALVKLEILASVGDGRAQSLLGDCYAFGWGVTRNDDEAIALYKRAGSGGMDSHDSAAATMYYTGRRFLGGTGVQRDVATARKWFERSAEEGLHWPLQRSRICLRVANPMPLKGPSDDA